MARSNTTMALSTILKNPSRLDFGEDEEQRCKRIFRRLEDDCGSVEARQSLREWQSAYARRQKRPDLLPSGVKQSGENKSRVARMFGGGSRAQRMSLIALTETGGQQSSKLGQQGTKHATAKLALR